MTIHKAVLYLRTLSYLRFEQILFRLWYRVRSVVLKKYYVSKLQQVPENIERTKLRHKTAPMEYPWFDNVQISYGHFRFLNDSADFGNGIDWQADGKSRLWRYNLHYFQYLHPKDGLDTTVALSVMMDWIKSNPPATIDAWDPAPTSLRIVNWIKFIIDRDISGIDYERLSRSLYQQSLWLENLPERHLLCNHLFKNAKAYIFAGLFFSTPDAERWLAKGLRLLERELSAQILPDGGHIERSPMYHCMILEDCLDLLNICMDNPSEGVREIAEQLEEHILKMMHFLCGMTHPDGQIALFNDSAFGVEVPPSGLMEYFKRLTGGAVEAPKPPFWAFPDTGYFIMAPRPGDRLIADCGPLGPDYQVGHGHCDSLSFELSANYSRIIVDSGCFSYQHDDMRQYNRGNAGHNTVTLDRSDQSEIWDSFRCGRRARPLTAKIWQDRDSLIFEGGHDGYRRLSGQPIHHRRIQWTGPRILIEDRIVGQGTYVCGLRLHINPSCKVRMEEQKVRISVEGYEVQVEAMGDFALALEDGWYCPSFGERLQCQVIVLNGHKEGPITTGWMISLD